MPPKAANENVGVLFSDALVSETFANGLDGVFAVGAAAEVAAAGLLTFTTLRLVGDAAATGMGGAADMGGCGAGGSRDDAIGFGAAADMGGYPTPAPSLALVAPSPVFAAESSSSSFLPPKAPNENAGLPPPEAPVRDTFANGFDGFSFGAVAVAAAGLLALTTLRLAGEAATGPGASADVGGCGAGFGAAAAVGG